MVQEKSCSGAVGQHGVHKKNEFNCLGLIFYFIVECFDYDRLKGKLFGSRYVCKVSNTIFIVLLSHLI